MSAVIHAVPSFSVVGSMVSNVVFNQLHHEDRDGKIILWRNSNTIQPSISGISISITRNC